jgi:DNA helicase-2/ATP-dependent DNA helicase PcrA
VVRANHLTTSYRSTRPIADFAHRLLGPIAPAAAPKTIRDGVPVAKTFFRNDGHAVIFLRDALMDLVTREPMASVAIICHGFKFAEGFFQALKDLPRVRYCPDGDFAFAPGIDITLVPAVKGLEFDYVVIPDASSNHYPDTHLDRRLLHVAATRAIHQLWVIAIGRESPIIRGLPEE